MTEANMGEQLSLLKDWAALGDQAEAMLDIIEAGIHREIGGVKQFAALVGKSPGQVRDALHQNGKHFSVLWVPVFCKYAPIHSHKLLNLLCDLNGMQHPEPVRAQTPEEELAALKDRIALHGLEPVLLRG